MGRTRGREWIEDMKKDAMKDTGESVDFIVGYCAALEDVENYLYLYGKNFRARKTLMEQVQKRMMIRKQQKQVA
jgi:hypothetical protein